MHPNSAWPAGAGARPTASRGRRALRTASATALAAILGLGSVTVMASPVSAAPLVGVAVSSPTVAEGATMTFDLAVAATATTETITWTTADGTATAGQDYTAVTGSMSVTNGVVATRQITVPILSDNLREGNETLTLNVLGGTTGNTASGTGTITDDATDTVNTFSLTLTTAGDEDAPTDAVVTATLAAAPIVDVTISLTTSNGTAKVGEDFTALTAGTKFEFTAGGASTDTVTISVIDDTVYEGGAPTTQSFTATATAGSNVTGTDSVTVTIADDDAAPTVTMGADDVASEGETLTFWATLSHTSELAGTVVATTANGTADAGSDYTAVAGVTVTFPAGTTRKSITVQTLTDVVDEVPPPETLTVTLSAPVNLILGGDVVATGGITEDATFSVADVEVAEGDSNHTATVTVRLSAAATAPITFTVGSAPGTATAGGTDYTAPDATLTVASGATSGTISLPITGDTMYEDDETLTVTVTLGADAGGITADVNTATVTITNDDSAPRLVLSAISAAEGSALTLTATITGTSAEAYSVTPTITAGSVGGSNAAEDADFTITTAPVALNAAGTAAAGTVAIANDTIDEPVETLVLSATVTAGTVTVVDGVVRITDDPDDVGPRVSLGSDRVVAENIGTVSIPVTAAMDSGTTENTVVVRYATWAGTARAGADFSGRTGTVSFAPGDTSKSVSVPIINDSIDEPSQYFWFRLLSATPSDTPMGDATMKITITDNDAARAPTLSVSPTVRNGRGWVRLSGMDGEGSTVTLWAGTSAGNLRWIGSVRTNYMGWYYNSRVISRTTYFQARVGAMKSPIRRTIVR